MCIRDSFGALAAFGIGNMTQSNAIAQVLNTYFNVPHLATGIALAVLVGAVVIGGLKSIVKVTEILVPFMLSLIHI